MCVVAEYFRYFTLATLNYYTSSLTMLATSVSSYVSRWITSWSIQKLMHLCAQKCVYIGIKLYTAKRQHIHFYIPRTSNCVHLQNVAPTIYGSYVLVLIEFKWPTPRMVVSATRLELVGSESQLIS